MNAPIRVKVDEVVVTFVEPSSTDKIAIKEETEEVVLSRSIDAAKICAFLLFRKTILAIEGINANGEPKCFRYSGDSQSDQNVLNLMAWDTPTREKIMQISLWLSKGVRSEWVDGSGKPIPGVQILPQLELLN